MYKYNTPVYRAESLHRKRDASAEGRTFAAYKKHLRDKRSPAGVLVYMYQLFILL